MRCRSLPRSQEIQAALGGRYRVFVFDFETAGLPPWRDASGRLLHRPQSPGVCQTALGMLRADGSVLLESWKSNPGRPVDPEALKVHGLGDEELRDCPPFRDILPAFMEFVGSHTAPGETPVLVAHNGWSFDLPILLAECREAGRPLPTSWLHADSLVLARVLLSQLQSSDGRVGTREAALGKLFQFLTGTELGNAHRADVDVAGLARVMQGLVAQGAALTGLAPSHLLGVVALPLASLRVDDMSCGLLADSRSASTSALAIRLDRALRTAGMQLPQALATGLMAEKPWQSYQSLEARAPTRPAPTSGLEQSLRALSLGGTDQAQRPVAKFSLQGLAADADFAAQEAVLDQALDHWAHVDAGRVPGWASLGPVQRLSALRRVLTRELNQAKTQVEEMIPTVASLTTPRGGAKAGRRPFSAQQGSKLSKAGFGTLEELLLWLPRKHTLITPLLEPGFDFRLRGQVLSARLSSRGNFSVLELRVTGTAAWVDRSQSGDSVAEAEEGDESSRPLTEGPVVLEVVKFAQVGPIAPVCQSAGRQAPTPPPATLLQASSASGVRFHHWLLEQVQPGAWVVLEGKVPRDLDTSTIGHEPVRIKTLDSIEPLMSGGSSAGAFEESIRVVYSARTPLSAQEMGKAVAAATDALLGYAGSGQDTLLADGSTWYEPLPAPLRRQLDQPSYFESLLRSHRPKTLQEDRTPILESRAFLLCLAQQLTILTRRGLLEAAYRGLHLPAGSHTPLMDSFRAALGFQLTAAQEAVIQELVADMSGPVPMRRLLQGEVGSGKTAVAFFCMVAAVGAGHQAALMAPTEVLAEQHYKRLQEVLGRMQGPVPRAALLTGSLPAAERQAIQAAIQAGEIDLVIGTHALIQRCGALVFVCARRAFLSWLVLDRRRPALLLPGAQ